MPRVILEVRDLWMGDGPGATLQDVSFTVGPGQVLGVLGGPGAGKSTLLRCAGLDFDPTAGVVLLRGEQVSGASAERRRRLRGGRLELVHPPAPAADDGVHAPVPCRRLLLGTGRAATVPVAGMRQRIQIAKALTNRAEVLLLDEPFARVEPAVTGRILELLDRLRREAGTAVVLATRDPELCLALADELVVLDEGSVVERGPAATVLADPAGRRIGAVLGTERRSA